MQVRLEALREMLAPYPWAYTLLMLAALLLVAWLANFITKRVLLRGLRHVLARVAELTGHHAGGSISRMRVVSRLANVVPALVIGSGIALVPDLPPRLVVLVSGLCQVFVIFTVALAVGHALDVANEIYERRPDARNKPIKGYLQVAKIIVLVMAALGSVALLAGVDLVHVLTGLGAASAVLMLIFQDTILSFAASLQISGDGRVRIGDWIEMPSQNADGDVMDIALHTVTVQNWDKTITTVPTRKLISDSFKNWRGMTESGGRRIKRAIYLDQHSTRFLDADEVARFRRFRLLDAYLDGKSSELQDWNAKLAERGAEPVNRRRVTNLGTFRAYVEQYLRSHPGVHQDMSLMVRQLQPTDAGLPLEIYCFTNDVRWAVYEGIQADIFDHLLAILPEFGLRVFQAHSDAPVEVRLRDERAPEQGSLGTEPA
ncbi:mechanosensitive ion channel family protein [Luteimonas sp. A649]